MATCGSWSVCRYDKASWTAFPLRCRRWDCPSCAPRQKRRFLKALSLTHVDALLTLTCNPQHYANPDAAFRHMSRQLPNLMKRLRRQLPRAGLQYVVIWESTKRGWPHAHVLLRGPYLPQRLVSHIWDSLAFSRIIDIRRVHRPEDVRSYVGKYLVKQPAVPPGYRRFRSSEDFWQTEPPNRHHRPDPNTPWSVQRLSLGELSHRWAAWGFQVTLEMGYSLVASRTKPPSAFNLQAALGRTIGLPLE